MQPITSCLLSADILVLSDELAAGQPVNVTQYIVNVGTAIAKTSMGLLSMGFKTIFIANVVPMDLLPYTRSMGPMAMASAKLLSAAVNEAISKTVKQLSAAKAKVFLWDIHTAVTKISEKPFL